MAQLGFVGLGVAVPVGRGVSVGTGVMVGVSLGKGVLVGGGVGEAAALVSAAEVDASCSGLGPHAPKSKESNDVKTSTFWNVFIFQSPYISNYRSWRLLHANPWRALLLKV